MRRIVTSGLYTQMEGIIPGTTSSDTAEVNESPDQQESNNLDGDYRSLAHNSRSSRASIERIASGLRFAALQKTVTNGKRAHASLPLDLHK